MDQAELSEVLEAVGRSNIATETKRKIEIAMTKTLLKEKEPTGAPTESPGVSRVCGEVSTMG